MSTLAEIEAAVPSLSLDELQRLERIVHALYRQRGAGLVADDTYGTVSDEDLIAEADAAFLAYDKAEADHGHRATR